MSETTRKPGRPTKRNEDVARILCQCIERGLPHVHACAVAGVSPAFFHNWRQEDPDFNEQVELALSNGLNARLKIIEQEAKNDWRCAAWWCEHVLPQYFSRTRIEVTGELAAQVAVLVWPHQQAPNLQHEKDPSDYHLADAAPDAG
jgi:hypothetical protein